MAFKVIVFNHTRGTETEHSIVTEDHVRYMKAGHHKGEFFTKDPQWAIDFAPNGKWAAMRSLYALTVTRYLGWCRRYDDEKTICQVQISLLHLIATLLISSQYA